MKNLLAGILCIIFVLFLGSCKDGKDGERGVAGITGPSGIDGAIGPDGPLGFMVVSTHADIIAAWHLYKDYPADLNALLIRAGRLTWSIRITEVHDLGYMFGQLRDGGRVKFLGFPPQRAKAKESLVSQRYLDIVFDAKDIANAIDPVIAFKNIISLGGV